MSLLCTYTVATDSGLAPNPFWGWCSMAVCTPNYQNVKLEMGSWLVGFLSRDRGNRLLYAMQVCEVIDRDAYFRDKRFLKKKPVIAGGWKQRCGDNFYWQDEQHAWERLESPHHDGSMMEKDTRNRAVFLAKRFFYFGEAAPQVPDRFRSLVHVRGCKRSHSTTVSLAFIQWLTAQFSPGIHGDPIDRESSTCQRTSRPRTKCPPVCYREDIGEQVAEGGYSNAHIDPGTSRRGR